jgi:AcrR family transcriptional regulator
MSAVTPQRKESNQARGAVAERRVFEATERLLADGQTFTELSVERLAAEAGIARSTFYVHFKDKGDLVARLTQAVIEEFDAVSVPIRNLGVHTDFQQARESIRAIVGVYARHDLLMATIVETAAYEKRVRRVHRAMMERTIDAIASVLEQGGGNVRPVPARETAVALAWMIEHSCHQMARGASEEELDRLAHAVASVFWNALFSQPR